MKLSIPTAEIFEPALEPSRYKALFGGRGSGKSRFFASLMIEEHLRFPGFRSICIREIQKSLKDSAKRILEDRIKEYGLLNVGFKPLNDCIKTPGDGIIVFQGMQDHNSETIKSFEGFNRAWVEEGQTLSARSLELLRPTIRAPGSEIWFSWNPRLPTDPVDAMFRSEKQPDNAIIVQSNWNNNPWFPEELEKERHDDLERNPDQYGHIWNGDYITVVSGAYFARDLSLARQEHRICHLATDALLPLHAFIDIGGTGAKSDAFSMWVTQFVGKEIRNVNYYEAVGQPLSEHVAWLRKNGYDDIIIHLPHDGNTNDRVFNVTFESEFKRAGFNVKPPLKNQGSGAARQRIEAVRKIFPNCWFDERKTSAGIRALGWYHEKIDEARGVGLGPDHDWSSHCADAFGLMALISEEIQMQQNRVKQHSESLSSGGWMG